MSHIKKVLLLSSLNTYHTPRLPKKSGVFSEEYPKDKKMISCINSPKLNDNMVTRQGSTKIKNVILSHAIIMVTLIIAFLIGAIFIFYDRGESLDKLLAMGENVVGQATLIKDSDENEGPIKEKIIVRIKDKVLLDAPTMLFAYV